MTGKLPLTSQERPFCLCIAGPNGSGKSTFTRILRRSFQIDRWIDPDVIAKEIRDSRAPEHRNLTDQQASRLAFRTARNQRVQLAAELHDFGFETVFSHSSNLDFLVDLVQIGYIVHIYFVCTEDFRINIGRVRNRVALGGHDVDDAAIQRRYFRSLKLLELAVHSIYRIVLFDNSDTELFGARASCEIANEGEWTRGFYRTRIEIDPQPHIPKWVMEVLQNAYSRLDRGKPEIYEIGSKRATPLSPENSLAYYRQMGPAKIMEHLRRHMMA
ncbi:MAG TPA: zeta toxin family protein [Bradyrhizobium sp.]|nr:zeta toxin family protein [Bradyrhizobium sp.]